MKLEPETLRRAGGWLGLGLGLALAACGGEAPMGEGLGTHAQALDEQALLTEAETETETEDGEAAAPSASASAVPAPALVRDAACTPELDLLLVVGDGPNMGPIQAQLAQKIPALIEWAVHAKVDLHLGVITTDASQGGCMGAGTAVPNYFLGIATPKNFASIAARIQHGTTGSTPERGLQSAAAAFGPAATTSCNAGFRRSGAELAVVVVSDEEDESPASVHYSVDILRSAASPCGKLSAIAPSSMHGGRYHQLAIELSPYETPPYSAAAIAAALAFEPFPFDEDDWD
jgi:hypothetical protein